MSVCVIVSYVCAPESWHLVYREVQQRAGAGQKERKAERNGGESELRGRRKQERKKKKREKREPSATA